MMWWARFTMVLAFYAAIVVVIAIAWERGPARSLRDVVVVASKIVGYLASLREVWVQEYDRYESQGNPRMRRWGRGEVILIFFLVKGGRWTLFTGRRLQETPC